MGRGDAWQKEGEGVIEEGKMYPEEANTLSR
jgi:hypothetical protein